MASDDLTEDDIMDKEDRDAMEDVGDDWFDPVFDPDYDEPDYVKEAFGDDD